MNKNKQQLAGLSLRELLEKLEDFRRELFTLRLSSATSHIKDNSQFKKLRKNIARALTLVKNHQSGQSVQELEK